MKFNRLFYILPIALLFNSCGEDLANLNVDPNISPTANSKEVLTHGQAQFANVLEGRMNEDCALFAQYWAGGPGVALLDHERYFFEPADFNAQWALSFRQCLSDLDYVIDNGGNGYEPIAQISSVAMYQFLVDQFGDIPYTEALRGALEDGSILTPKFDGAKSIYADLIARVTKAVADLEANSGSVGGEDLIYQGNAAKWIKYGNSLKLKLLVRQSGNDASVGPEIINTIKKGNFIETVADMPILPFSGEAGAWNPQYAIREQGISMFYVLSNSFFNKMKELNDPRTARLFNNAKKTNTLVGLDQGNINDVGAVAKDDYSFPSSVAYDKANDVIFMSNWEVYFLRAEAALRFSTGEDATEMFNQAVTQHFNYVGATGAADYLANSANIAAVSALDEKLEILAVQKWISMCGLQEAEGWIETRRFDTPSNPIFTNTSNGVFRTPTRTVLGQGVYPSIKLVPQSELSFNPNSPKDRKITDKVFWDN